MTQKAPKAGAHRVGVDADDVGPIINQKLGLNFTGHEFAHFTVIPSGGANPVVEIHAWDPVSGQFHQIIGAEYQPAAQGANISFQFTVRAAGRILFASIVGGTGAGSTDINASGWDSHGGAA